VAQWIRAAETPIRVVGTQVIRAVIPIRAWGILIPAVVILNHVAETLTHAAETLILHVDRAEAEARRNARIPATLV
jgi:hypothetical protein